MTATATAPKVVGEERRGLALGFAAQATWGLFPLYWHLLSRSGALETLAHRIVWSMLTLVVIVLVLRRLPTLRALARDGRTRGLLALAGVLISFNWGTYIYGVTHDHVVETALGYFINPLVTTLLGVVAFRERLRRVQWIALGIALLGVVGLSVAYGRPPWIALILAASFGSYGMVKKKAAAPTFEGMVVETGVLVPLALAYLIWLGLSGHDTAVHQPVWYWFVLIGAGPISSVPLLLFGGAAPRVPMYQLGIVQYVTPILQFVIGVVVFREAMPPLRLIGFAAVWVALVVLTVDGLRHRRPARQMADPAAV